MFRVAFTEVRTRRAPKGALRQLTNLVRDVAAFAKVREHRAPKGALRLLASDARVVVVDHRQ